MVAAPLFAQMPAPLESIAREFNRDVSTGGVAVLGIVVVGVIVLVAALAYWYRTRERSWRFYSRTALWRELCRVHELSPYERRLLREVARGAKLEPVAAIFLNPTALAAARKTAADLERAKQLGGIHERLFGS
jgi:hypothetical protein